MARYAHGFALGRFARHAHAPSLRSLRRRTAVAAAVAAAPPPPHCGVADEHHLGAKPKTFRGIASVRNQSPNV